MLGRFVQIIAVLLIVYGLATDYKYWKTDRVKDEDYKNRH